jgi:hypothetical protein
MMRERPFLTEMLTTRVPFSCILGRRTQMRIDHQFSPRGRHVLSLPAMAMAIALLINPTARCAEKVAAVPASDFLDSIGTLSAIAYRGETLEKTVECTKYLGIRWLRAGIEGDIPVRDFLELHKRTGVKFSWGLGSGGTDIPKLIATAKPLATAGALLAFEGPNEPNNWGFTYQGETGGRDRSWIAVAKLQRDLYQTVKSDPSLKKYPVWSISEGGAETDNVGLQFLTIPPEAHTSMPAGTRYADYANVHNYIYHPNSPSVEDNKTWNAADPTAACKVDGLYGEYGQTWAKHFPGYPAAQLLALPRVTTETGTTIGGAITEEIHAKNLLTLYLDQFKRGWSYTGVYLLRDRVDEAGNQSFGFYRPDYSRRKAAVYLHNLTTILADQGRPARLAELEYSIAPRPDTLHDLLLQKSDGSFALVIWNERVQGSDTITVSLDVRAAPVVKVHDPTLRVTVREMISNPHKLVLKLTDHPVVLEIRPAR